MSASDKAAETAVNIVADAAEEVSDHAEQFAEFARNMSHTRIKFAVGGWILGAATGALLAYKFTYSRAETKYSKIADQEIAEMRQHYTEKIKAWTAETAKRPVDEIVRERGYLSDREEEEDNPPPMVIKPPTPEPNIPRPIPNDEEQAEITRRRNVFEEAQVDHQWNWHEERKNRSPDIPYVIHVDEKEEMDYQSMTLTYYEGDDVLCREEDNSIVDPDFERDSLIGEANLDRFGHGSEDASIVYIRNDKLELVLEVIRAPGKYAEDVHGFTHDSASYKNLERMRVRERDEQEE